MIESASLVTICVDGPSLSTLKQVASTTGVIELRDSFQHYFADPEDLVLFEPPDVCVIDFDKDPERAALTAERIRKAFAETVIFATSLRPEADQVMRVMRCGCREYLVKPLDQDAMLEALVPVWRKKREKTVEDRPQGQVLAFVGSKGGCGVTTLVTHLGALLARVQKRKVLLVDHHPHLGDASFYLAVENPEYHFSDLVQSAGRRLDADYLQPFLARHPSGLEVMPSPDNFETSGSASTEGVEHTLSFLKSRYEFVLVDCPPGLNDRNLALLHHCDQVHVVTVPEIPALRNVTRCIAYLEKHRYPTERIRLVLNRHSRHDSISDGAIERAIEVAIHWKVPNQYADVVTAINAGTPDTLSTNSEFMRNLIRWAEAVAAKRAVPVQTTPPAAQSQPLPSALRLTTVEGN